ncbi:unnamed protein product [Cylicostephanus goldi]|uniref:Electron transfer flavoprotein alpha subunit C-terminal domain-containing protein n=1 Tax=Cylicostephanus goldi TaxID=71465 RepID=A0A3P6R4R5_CYLGO|nr:unnamed protein product [Cylicostephanus goldi]
MQHPQRRSKQTGTEFCSTRIVVPATGAFKSNYNLKLIYDFADKFGAGVGASRAAVDSGYVHSDTQVGQTETIIAPARELYIAIGISGDNIWLKSRTGSSL